MGCYVYIYIHTSIYVANNLILSALCAKGSRVAVSKWQISQNMRLDGYPICRVLRSFQSIKIGAVNDSAILNSAGVWILNVHC